MNKEQIDALLYIKNELKEIRKEILAIMEESKISSNAVLKVTSDSTENKKESEVAVCEICAGYDDGWDDSITCTKCKRWLTL